MTSREYDFVITVLPSEEEAQKETHEESVDSNSLSDSTEASTN